MNRLKMEVRTIECIPFSSGLVAFVGRQNCAIALGKSSFQTLCKAYSAGPAGALL